MKNVIIFNGPAGSGKDYLADKLNEYCTERQLDSCRKSFKGELQSITAKLFKFDPKLFTTKSFYGRTTKETKKDFLAVDLKLVIRYYNMLKDSGLETLHHFFSKELEDTIKPLLGKALSPREALIFVSEKLIKPVFGKDYFGYSLSLGLEDGYNIISDGGFLDEILPLLVESEKITIVTILSKGFGKMKKDEYFDFSNDSREYIIKLLAAEIVMAIQNERISQVQGVELIGRYSNEYTEITKDLNLKNVSGNIDTIKSLLDEKVVFKKYINSEESDSMTLFKELTK